MPRPDDFPMIRLPPETFKLLQKLSTDLQIPMITLCDMIVKRSLLGGCHEISVDNFVDNFGSVRYGAPKSVK